ncbi:Rgg family transcriptional regulator [Streptococcus entericus]|uniref:Rgg/GadR/MutR family transcriptional regulator n=1 Tax=Streptococcus entericus TaxID=155680 RepID=UPI00036E3273|nr:Rgg/GadR/MutR family transcriptional regulator [Streptococcus entericus]
MEQKHTFGSAFKVLREKRGYSIKEACRNGAIMTPAALRRFEKEETSTSVDNLNRLLLAIGADWEDLLTLYDGCTVMDLLSKQATEMNNIQNTGHYHTLADVIEQLEIDIPENPKLSKLIGLATELAISSRKGNLVPINKEETRFSLIFEHFEKVETWGVLEESLFYQCLRLFEPEFVHFHIHKFLDDFEANPPKVKDNWASRFIIANYTVGYLSRKKSFQYADQLIARMENMFRDDKYINFWDEKFFLAMFKASHLIRQNKIEGLELAKTIVNTLKLFGEVYYSPYAIKYMNNYVEVVHSLNKTGIPFDPY